MTEEYLKEMMLGVMEEHSLEPCLVEWPRNRGEKQLEQSLEVKQHREENWGKKRVTSLVGKKSLTGERMEIVLGERQHQEVIQNQEENWGKKRVPSLVGQKSLQGERMEIVLEERQHQEGNLKEKAQEGL